MLCCHRNVHSSFRASSDNTGLVLITHTAYFAVVANIPLHPQPFRNRLFNSNPLFFSFHLRRVIGSQHCARFYLWHCTFVVWLRLHGGRVWHWLGSWQPVSNGDTKQLKINHIYSIWLHGRYRHCKPFVYLHWEKSKVCSITFFFFPIFDNILRNGHKLNRVLLFAVEFFAKYIFFLIVSSLNGKRKNLIICNMTTRYTATSDANEKFMSCYRSRILLHGALGLAPIYMTAQFTVYVRIVANYCSFIPDT